MLIDLLLAALSVLIFVPLVTGYCAYSYGRSFALWCGLGVVLPGVSFVVLTVLLYRKEMTPGERLVREAKQILATAAAPKVGMRY
ncbi:hypothetical protein [Hymenobacter cellulosivorans]|uniref:Uncharacterized protein n=1 Tax=Hymenobacter cellulosivorans TaxID=2932249 RepID=A0ABY4F689_9BACT|nr:hypothetical protein [Hymenobacter cellulosivorans]UOQ52048.1 hypothetical protein MUN80_20070 [Hymenobacter cellulosivorans]